MQEGEGERVQEGEGERMQEGEGERNSRSAKMREEGVGVRGRGGLYVLF